MTTYTDDNGFNKNSAGYPAHTFPRVHLIQMDLDFVAIAAARLAAGATALASGDVLEVLQIPAKTHVLMVGVDVLNAGTAALDLDIGDGSDPDGYLDGIAGDAEAGFSSAQAPALALTLTEGTPNTLNTYAITPAFFAGKYYGAADTIDMKFVGQVPGALVARMWALVVDCEGPARS